MTEAAGGGRAEMERRLTEKGLADETFRQRLLEDPRGAIEEELGTRLPAALQVVAVEETAETIYLVLPPLRSGDVQAEELSDRELEGVAGGGTWSTCQGAANIAQWC